MMGVGEFREGVEHHATSFSQVGTRQLQATGRVSGGDGCIGPIGRIEIPAQERCVEPS